MKRISLFIILSLIICVLFAACKNEKDADVTSYSEEYVYVPSTLPVLAETESVTTEPYTELTTLPAESYTDITAATTTEPSTTQPAATEPLTTIPVTAAPETTTAPVTSAPDTTAPTAAESTTVDLTIELPEANGTMEVVTSPDNKFIAAVASQKKTDTSLLAAVYSVPESGQNYVFEFYDADGRTKDDLRRVYLMDDACHITGVAAAKSSEKVNVSSTENWFCFNVLIKGVIFDAIAEDL